MYDLRKQERLFNMYILIRLKHNFTGTGTSLQLSLKQVVGPHYPNQGQSLDLAVYD